MTPKEHEDIINLIHSLANQDKYILLLHARHRMNERGLTDEDIKDILTNVNQILRIDEENPDGITSYKIEGGLHNHRLAIKFNLTELIIIITVMDRHS
ncbi:DUF4258 domain-containing protein [Paenibacillus illinoisensis]|uniref:DUF4258 domain-containing protein n=1 Tax=Paenibacillus illinoisensis TaxID=59845 RepID=UPI00301BC45E